jgi:hypothetical protein
VLKVPDISGSIQPAYAPLDITPSRLAKSTLLAEAAVASTGSDKNAAAQVATNVRNRMRFPQ